MSFDPRPPRPSPPDLPPARARLGAAAGTYRYLDTRPHPALGDSPISLVSAELWHELAELAIAPDATDATACALLRAIAADAVDAALAPGNERAPRDDLYVSAPAHIGTRRRVVWFQRDGVGGPITAYVPSDEIPPASS